MYNTIFPRTFFLNSIYLHIDYIHYGPDPYLMQIRLALWIYLTYAKHWGSVLIPVFFNSYMDRVMLRGLWKAFYYFPSTLFKQHKQGLGIIKS